MIMTIGLLPDAMEPGIHCVRTHWIRGFMAFLLVRRIRTVRLMVLACPESGFLGRAAGPRPANYTAFCRSSMNAASTLGSAGAACGTLGW